MKRDQDFKMKDFVVENTCCCCWPIWGNECGWECWCEWDGEVSGYESTRLISWLQYVCMSESSALLIGRKLETVVIFLFYSCFMKPRGWGFKKLSSFVTSVINLSMCGWNHILFEFWNRETFSQQGSALVPWLMQLWCNISVF